MAEKFKIISDLFVFSGTDTNNPNDLNKLKNTFDKEVKESSRLKVKLAAEEEDVSIALPDAACNFVAIFSDRDLNVVVNGDGTPESLTLKHLKPGVKAPVLLRSGDLTSLVVTNPGDKEVNLDIFIVKI